MPFRAAVDRRQLSAKDFLQGHVAERHGHAAGQVRGVRGGVSVSTMVVFEFPQPGLAGSSSEGRRLHAG